MSKPQWKPQDNPISYSHPIYCGPTMCWAPGQVTGDRCISEAEGFLLFIQGREDLLNVAREDR